MTKVKKSNSNKMKEKKDTKNILNWKKGENNKTENEIEKLKIENKKLKKTIKEMEEIIKNTQLQYISLKDEFDAYQNRVKSQQNKLKQETFEKVILDVLPIIEMFLQSYEYLPDEFKWHKWSEWLNIINKKIKSFFEDFWIEVIPTVWETPNEIMHEIIHIQNVSDKEKWKIIQEIKKWYMLKTPEGNKVLLPAKVILWE